MRIIIIGDGKVGYTLAESLSQEDHDVTVIDKSEQALIRVADNLDVMYLKGNGASITTLKEAGAAKADVLIAVTTSDEVNMLCCLTAKKLGTAYTAARIRDPGYVRDVSQFKRQLDIDLVINPERSTAVEILRLLRFPTASDIETFSHGRVEMIGFHLRETDGITGLTLSDMRRKINIPVLVCVVERGDEAFIPRGDFVVTAGDLVYVAGTITDITKFFRAIGRKSGAADNVMILGGGRITHYLAQFAVSAGIKPVIVEADPDICEQLASDIPQATVINGDGTEQELLEAENIGGMDAFVALTGSDEENMVISLYAKQRGVRKVVPKVNRSSYGALVKTLGIESAVSPKEITANHLLHFIRGLENSQGSAVEALYRLLGGRIEALEFAVRKNMRHLGVKIKKLPLRRNLVIAVISRGGRAFIPEGDDSFQEGDRVVVVTGNLGYNDLDEIFGD